MLPSRAAAAFRYPGLTAPPVETFLLNHKVNGAACVVLVLAVASVESSALPPPLCGLIDAYTDTFGSLKTRARLQPVDTAASGTALGMPANSIVLFRDLLPVNAAGHVLLTGKGARMLAGLLAQVLEHGNYSAAKSRGVFCEQCSSAPPLLCECRLMQADLVEDTHETCCSCFAQGRDCTWPETPDDFEA